MGFPTNNIPVHTGNLTSIAKNGHIFMETLSKPIILEMQPVGFLGTTGPPLPSFVEPKHWKTQPFRDVAIKGGTATSGGGGRFIS